MASSNGAAINGSLRHLRRDLVELDRGALSRGGGRGVIALSVASPVRMSSSDSKKEIPRLVPLDRSSNSMKRVAGTPSGGPVSPLI